MQAQAANTPAYAGPFRCFLQGLNPFKRPGLSDLCAGISGVQKAKSDRFSQRVIFAG
jgi:hypothetical protein